MGYKPGKAIIIYDADLIALMNRLGRLQDLRPGAAVKAFLRKQLPGHIKELQAQKGAGASV